MIVCIVPGAGQSHCSVGCFYFYLSLIENSLELDGGGYNGLTKGWPTEVLEGFLRALRRMAAKGPDPLKSFFCQLPNFHLGGKC